MFGSVILNNKLIKTLSLLYDSELNSCLQSIIDFASFLYSFSIAQLRTSSVLLLGFFVNWHRTKKVQRLLKLRMQPLP